MCMYVHVLLLCPAFSAPVEADVLGDYLQHVVSVLGIGPSTIVNKCVTPEGILFFLPALPVSTMGYLSCGPIEVYFVTSACARRTGVASQAYECMHNTLNHRGNT